MMLCARKTATRRLYYSNLKSWNDGSGEPGGDSLEHAYAGSRHVQNYDPTGPYGYGGVWNWAGSGVLRGPDPDTASQSTYKISNNSSPQGFSQITTSGTALTGDKRVQYAQGRPMAKDASGSGSNWSTGTTSAVNQPRQTAVESRFFFTGTVAPTDMSRATDKREKDRLGVFGTSNSYAGSYGRVTSEPIGRDLNPLGRGSGQALCRRGNTVPLARYILI
jgi:hypothetical protein